MPMVEAMSVASPPTGTRRSVGLLLVMALVSPAAATRSWRMLDQYPNHYVSHKLKPSESITVDGKLDEPAWMATEAMDNIMVDITRHSDQQLNAIPMDLQARSLSLPFPSTTNLAPTAPCAPLTITHAPWAHATRPLRAPHPPIPAMPLTQLSRFAVML